MKKNNTPDVLRVSDDGVGNLSELRALSKRKRTPIAAAQGDDKSVVNVDDGDDKPVVTADKYNKPMVTADGGEQQEDGMLSADTVTSSPQLSPVEIDTGDVRPVDSLPSIPISDLSVFDCCICCQSLTLPVFVCVKGHRFCSSCHKKEIKENCPKCPTNISISRCQAIEGILRSIKVSCFYKSYGCPKEFSYSAKRSHEWSCSYAPFGCPVADCTFVGCERKISDHVIKLHQDSVIRIFFNKKLYLNGSEKGAVLREGNRGDLFFLDMSNGISLTCIEGYKLTKGDTYPYAVIVKGLESSIRFQSVAKPLFENAPKEFFEIPHSFAPKCDGSLLISVRIWQNDYYGCPDISDNINKRGW